MAVQQINTNQISATGSPSASTFLRGDGSWSAPASGSGVETKFITLSGGSADQTTSAFSFVVGPVMIELLMDADNNGVSVHSVLWVNMRSFSGTKTANVTNRIARGPGNGGHIKADVDRTTSGTVLVIGQLSVGAEVNPSGTGAASYTAYNWPSSGRLRITAWEDTQS